MLCMCMCSLAQANDTKIVHRRDVQCTTEE